MKRVKKKATNTVRFYFQPEISTTMVHLTPIRQAEQTEQTLRRVGRSDLDLYPSAGAGTNEYITENVNGTGDKNYCDIAPSCRVDSK
ncbi:uncharacterized protein Dyak_GE27789 [Drosophila yakuba]|uniref:Uncharacterized protein n=1 Tax=Drosophila yakuba TaxID=7245 RepID=A0A0R1E997_DROYA|nr:uncharacterized protein Dyak_GE27789 [Drosophila yakuba]